MRRISLELAMVIFLLVSLVAWGKRNSKESSTINWILAWEDNFEGDSLDMSVWSYMPRRGSGSWRYYSTNPECYEVKEGCLTIRGIVNPNFSNDTSKLITGGVYTKFKKSFSPGRFEFMAKIKNATGATASIWLMPFNPENGWPDDGEIDIMEHANYADYVTQTVHSRYTHNNANANPQRFIKVSVESEKFNKYTVEISENEIDFYVNDRHTLSYPRISTLENQGQYPFYRDWFVILNTNLNVRPSVPVKEAELPVELKVDWVKYYIPNYKN